MHLFYDCLIVKKIWNQLKSILSSNLNFLISAPQSTIGFWDLVANEHLFFNHLLLIFKMYSYSARATVVFNLCNLLIYIKGIKDTKKKKNCENDAKRRKFNKEWKNVLIN